MSKGSTLLNARAVKAVIVISYTSSAMLAGIATYRHIHNASFIVTNNPTFPPLHSTCSNLAGVTRHRLLHQFSIGLLPECRHLSHETLVSLLVGLVVPPAGLGISINPSIESLRLDSK